jgi:dienelactone hydrolase
VGGDRQDEARGRPQYFAEHGIAAFAITYRPATEFPYPAAVQDVSAAIRWVRAHADDYQVDPAELGAIGVSSGGHLAALVAATGTGPLDRGSRVAVVASWSGMVDLRPLADSPDEEMRSAVRTFLGCSTSATCADPARRASPIVYVDPSDPPMVLVNSTEEIVPVDQAESMGQALEDAGIQSDVEITQGGHGAGYGGGNKILDRIIPFVQAWIAGRDAPSTVPPGDSGQGGSDGGKGGVAPAPSAPPAIPSASPVAPAPAAGDKHQEARPEPARVVSVGGTSLGAVIVAVAMIALLLVVGQLLVIARLRRRVAALGSRVSEDAGPPTASAEGA